MTQRIAAGSIMAGRMFSVIAGVSAAALVAASAVAAQSSAPSVRLAALPSIDVGTIHPSISLSESAYILAVAIDRDGRVSVLSPEMPSNVMRFEAANSIRLPDFFSGFSTASHPYYGGYRDHYYRASFFGAGDRTAANGSVLVIASRTPLNFAAISEGLHWNEQALERIVRYRTPSIAVTALGRAVTEKGQGFGHDYVYFGSSGYSQFASSGFSNYGNCAVDYSHSPFGYTSFASYAGVTGFYLGATPSTGYTLVSIGTDNCGRPRYVIMPYKLIPPPEPVPDSVKTETPKFRSAAAGTYTGDDARRLLEVLKRQGASEGYSLITSPHVYSGEEKGAAAGRPVIRESAPANSDQGFERVRSNTHPIEREAPPAERRAPPAPVVREQPVQRQPQPVIRSEPRALTPKTQTAPSTPAVVIQN